MRFDDYHRTIVGYHGTRLSVALDIVQRKRGFNISRNRDDWLGHGIYFWEYAPRQALWWAERRRKRQKWDEPVAILASMIRLGFCFDLLDPYNVKYLKEVHAEFSRTESEAGRTLPRNANFRKYLDCAVFQYAYTAIETLEGGQAVDTARAVYVPTDESKRVWTRSWIADGAHIQVCVRNPACILGTWLHYAGSSEDVDAEKIAEVSEDGIQPTDRPGGETAQGDVGGGPHSTHGDGGADDSGGSGRGET
ncbi:MAG TPA: hypothetical protein VF170_07885 [Planctomycetaceae bacterium]